MSDTASNFAVPHFGNIPIACIVPSKTNPRKTFKAIEQLADSIKAQGLGQPILVRPISAVDGIIDPVEIVAGERRWRAAKMAGLEIIPAIVRDMSDAQAEEFQLIENCQREDVPEIEEAEGFERLMKEHGYTAEQLAKRIGMSKSHVYARLKLCSLSQPARDILLQHELSASIALLIARIPVPSLQEHAASEVSIGNNGEPMSYRKAVAHLQERYMLNLDRARFSIKDAKLVPTAGSCATCPNRTGNQPEVFADVSADICTDPNCFASKTKAHDDKTLLTAQKKGIPVYEGEEAKTFRKETDLVPESTSLYTFERPDYSVGASRPVAELVPEELLPKPSAYIRVDGKVQAMYEKTAMQAALEKAGACETEEQRAERQKQRVEEQMNDPAFSARKEKEDAREAAADRESCVRVEAYKRIRSTVASGLSADLLRLVLKSLLGQFGYSEHSLPSHSLQDLYTFDTESEEAIFSHIDQAPIEELQLLLMDIVLGWSISVRTFDLTHDGALNPEDESFLQFAALTEAAGINLDDIRAELAPESLPNDQTSDVQPEDMEQAEVKVSKKVQRKTAKLPVVTAAEVTKRVLSPDAAWPFPTSARMAAQSE